MTQTGGAVCNFADGNQALPRDVRVAGEMSWFAVQTKPRHEKRVAAGLKEKGVLVFLPLFSAVHQWSDRRRLVELPLFTNYVFVRIGAEREVRIPVLRTSGVVGFVGMRAWASRFLMNKSMRCERSSGREFPSRPIRFSMSVRGFESAEEASMASRGSFWQ